MFFPISRELNTIKNKLILNNNENINLNGDIFINNVSIKESTSNGFIFKIDISESTSNEIPPYKIELFSEEYAQNTLWTSTEQTEIGQRLLFTVDGLSEQRMYTNLSFQLIDSNNPEKKYGNQFYSNMNIFTTTNKVDEIIDGSAKVTSINENDFNLSLDIDGDSGEKFVNPYMIAVYSNDDDNSPIWRSQELLKIGNDMNFKVDHLWSNHTYSNVKVSLIDVNTWTKEKNLVFITNEIRTSKHHNVASIFTIIFLIILIMILIVMIFHKQIIKKYDSWTLKRNIVKKMRLQKSLRK